MKKYCLGSRWNYGIDRILWDVVVVEAHPTSALTAFLVTGKSERVNSFVASATLVNGGEWQLFGSAPDTRCTFYGVRVMLYKLELCSIPMLK